MLTASLFSCLSDSFDRNLPFGTVIFLGAWIFLFSIRIAKEKKWTINPVAFIALFLVLVTFVAFLLQEILIQSVYLSQKIWNALGYPAEFFCYHVRWSKSVMTQAYFVSNGLVLLLFNTFLVGFSAWLYWKKKRFSFDLVWAGLIFYGINMAISIVTLFLNLP